MVAALTEKQRFEAWLERSGQLAFEAPCARKLAIILGSWGASAPPRLERRGRQPELDRWCFGHFLRHRLAAGNLGFPVSVFQGENPDFVLEEFGARAGIEVTEAVDPPEQRQWTLEDKDDWLLSTPIPRDIRRDATSGNRYQGMIAAAIEKKTRKCSALCSDLLIYLNTQDAWFVEPRAMVAALSDVTAQAGRFERLWVLRDRSLVELKSSFAFSV